MFRGIKKIAAEFAAFPLWYIAFALFFGVLAEIFTDEMGVVVTATIAGPVTIAIIFSLSRYGVSENNIHGWKERVGVIGVGYLGNALLTYPFDYLLYPAVIWWLGILKGGAVMTVLSFLYCWGILIFYDWAKKDWLGIEMIKEVREYDGGTTIGKITGWILKKGNLMVMLFLSIKFDPVIATVYMRHGANNYNGLSGRDWKIFIASTLIGNTYWTLVAFTGVSIGEFLWEKLL